MIIAGDLYCYMAELKRLQDLHGVEDTSKVQWLPWQQAIRQTTQGDREMTTPVQEGRETKEDRFIRLGESRMALALEAMRKLGALSDQNHYEYTDMQVAKMIAALHVEVDKLDSKFSALGNKPHRLFSFGDNGVPQTDG